MKINDTYKKYRNPDKRCKYPFTAEPLGYCWSYANHVDGDEKFQDMEAICKTCDLWEVMPDACYPR